MDATNNRFYRTANVATKGPAMTDTDRSAFEAWKAGRFAAPQPTATPTVDDWLWLAWQAATAAERAGTLTLLQAFVAEHPNATALSALLAITPSAPLTREDVKWAQSVIDVKRAQSGYPYP